MDGPYSNLTLLVQIMFSVPLSQTIIIRKLSFQLEIGSLGGLKVCLLNKSVFGTIKCAKYLNVTQPLSYECFLLIQLEILNYNIRYLKFSCCFLFNE